MSSSREPAKLPSAFPQRPDIETTEISAAPTRVEDRQVLVDDDLELLRSRSEAFG